MNYIVLSCVSCVRAFACRKPTILIHKVELAASNVAVAQHIEHNSVAKLYEECVCVCVRRVCVRACACVYVCDVLVVTVRSMML